MENTENIETNSAAAKSEPVTVDQNNPQPCHQYTYAILMETNDTEAESWYFFLRKEGNEEALKYLQNQLEQVKWELMEDLSTFDLELDYYVSASTAKEMTKVDLNAHSFHRKFDGKLEMIDLGFNKKDKNKTKICKAFDILGYGQIEEFISDEDIDEEDLVERSSGSESESESESSSSSSSDEDENEKRPVKKLPSSLSSSSLPGWVKNKKKKQIARRQ